MVVPKSIHCQISFVGITYHIHYTLSPYACFQLNYNSVQWSSQELKQFSPVEYSGIEEDLERHKLKSKSSAVIYPDRERDMRDQGCPELALEEKRLRN